MKILNKILNIKFSRKRKSKIIKLLSKMSFLINRKQFNNLYNKRVYAIALNLEKLYQKSMKINQHITFLKQCKQENVIPNGMYLNNVTNNIRNKKLLRNTMTKIRNNMLTWRYKQQKYLNSEISTQEKILNIYMNNIQPKRQHENDIKWMNKHDKNKKKKMQEKKKQN